MAHGIELILGWPFKDWARLTDLKLPRYMAVKTRSPFQIALPWEALADEDPEELDPDGDSEPMNVHDAFRPVLEAFDGPLREAHSAALVEAGFRIIEVKRKKDRYIPATTPQGEREFVPFCLELSYDPDEMGDDADAAIIGVSITGRYFPTFADWKDACGTLSPMVFDTELLKLMEIAKRHITGVLPCLAEAPWLVKEKHY